MARKVDVTGIKLADEASKCSSLKGGAISAACMVIILFIIIIG